uniref:Uncharacterized protein n=1 Tax=Rhizophagus irregularis (strain DAOM 181602 / DAOM 197198 / MUCL 43194) TaxID=747089 RepID=U9SRU1_RHIID
MCQILYSDAELFTHEKWDKNKNRSASISKSRIDQIWITHEPDVIPVEFLVHLLQMVTNSHHMDISKITNVQWENFTEILDREIEAWDFQQLIERVNYEIQLGDEKSTDGEEIKRRFNEL